MAILDKKLWMTVNSIFDLIKPIVDKLQTTGEKGMQTFGPWDPGPAIAGSPLGPLNPGGPGSPAGPSRPGWPENPGSP